MDKYITSAGGSSVLKVQYWEPGQLLTRHYTAPWHLRSICVVDGITCGDGGDVALPAAGSETTAAKTGADAPTCELVASGIAKW